MWQNRSYYTKHTLFKIFIPVEERPQHSPFCKVFFLFADNTWKKGCMNFPCWVSCIIWYSVWFHHRSASKFCHDTLIKGSLFLPIIWNEVMPIYIIVYFQCHYSLTHCCWDTCILHLKSWLIQLQSSDFLYISISVFQVLPFFRYIISWNLSA